MIGWPKAHSSTPSQNRSPLLISTEKGEKALNRVEKEWSEMVMPVECNMGLDELRGSNRITQNWRLEWKESGKAAT